MDIIESACLLHVKVNRQDHEKIHLSFGPLLKSPLDAGADECRCAGRMLAATTHDLRRRR
jgi:hypothetical protein